jgi:pimeloyl-ACP methyl ester carboxylesterase
VITAVGPTVELAHTEVGDGPPVVLIMGINAGGDAWQPHVGQWSRAFRCIAVDNRGAGASPAPPGPYDTADLAEDYARLITGLGLTACRVVGISMGSAIAQQLALSHPDLVERLVLVATWADPDPYVADVLRVIGRVRTSADAATFTSHLQTLIWTPQWFAEHYDELVAARDVPPAVGPAALQAQIDACVGHQVGNRLQQIAVPTLVTAGGQDRFIPCHLAREVADAIPGAGYELFERTGHVHHWEELDRFNDLVEEFLS